LVRRLVEAHGADIVFQPTPIASKAVSMMYGVGVPVVIGPMCGGMEFPAAFRRLESWPDRLSTLIGRPLAELANRIFPGKLQADALLVANERTRRALPKGCRGTVYEVVESGVDLAVFKPRERPPPTADQPVRFVYMARFVDQKGIPYLVEAFERVASRTNAILELIGDGELHEATREQVARAGLQHKVVFHGRLSLDAAAKVVQASDVYVVPAIRDCGGLAMLEAMAIGMPVIAANWAGPGQYADATCGILVDLPSREGFVQGLADAMVTLAESPELRSELGEGSIRRVRTNNLDWDSKVERVLQIFADVIQRAASESPLESVSRVSH
jgi:glycosyltransferase involved in cell wall biosynthesis